MGGLGFGPRSGQTLTNQIGPAIANGFRSQWARAHIVNGYHASRDPHSESALSTPRPDRTVKRTPSTKVTLPVSDIFQALEIANILS